MQYVACKFRESDTRSYTYAWDGDPFAPGDVACVEDRSGDGWKKVFVVGVSDEAPPFQCKPILRRYVDHCATCGGEPVVTELDGDKLCQPCADNWVRGERPEAFDATVPERIPAASDPLHDDIPW